MSIYLMHTCLLVQVYSLEQLEQARTHEDIWNAAQRQMAKTGVLRDVPAASTRVYEGVGQAGWAAFVPCVRPLGSLWHHPSSLFAYILKSSSIAHATLLCISGCTRITDFIDSTSGQLTHS